ncbi:globin-like protein [Xylariales sp. PMI_506]|nr:globin-like protein [Xylariales sp. PMI_506]
MALSYQQMKLVKGTVPALQEHGEHIATVFYKTMLKEHPDLNNYFNAVHMKNGSQPRALTRLILAFASNVTHISELVPKLERVANKHVSLGIQHEHYGIVCKYLMRAFAAVLGAAMTIEVRTAWTKAYWIMANMLTAREEQLYRDFEKWKGFRRFIINKKTPETKEGDVVSFELKPVDGAPLPKYMPGQYISLRTRTPDSAYHQIRQYSLSDAYNPDSYRITVKRVSEKPGKYSPGGGDAAAPQAGQRHGRSPASSRSGHGTRPHSRSSSFSTAVASTDGESFLGIMDYSARKGGLVSRLLVDDTMVGDTVELSHPVGEYYLDMDNDSGSTPLVLISSGVGVAPLMAMFNSAVQVCPDRPITWVQGSARSTPFEDRVANYAKDHPSVRTTYFKTEFGSQDLADSTESLGYGYYLEFLKPEDMYFGNRSTEYFICGSERFMLDMANYLKSSGVPSSQFHFELHTTGWFEVKDD